MACLPESDSGSGTNLQIYQQKRSPKQEPVELGIAGRKVADTSTLSIEYLLAHISKIVKELHLLITTIGRQAIEAQYAC